MVKDVFQILPNEASEGPTNLSLANIDQLSLKSLNDCYADKISASSFVWDFVCLFALPKSLSINCWHSVTIRAYISAFHSKSPNGNTESRLNIHFIYLFLLLYARHFLGIIYI